MKKIDINAREVEMRLGEKIENEKEIFLKKLESLHGSYEKVIGNLQNELVLLQEIHSLEKIAFGKNCFQEKEFKKEQWILLRKRTKEFLLEVKNEKEDWFNIRKNMDFYNKR